MRKWVAANLPTVAAFAASVRAEFADARMNWASENGNALGKESGLFGTGVSGSDLAISRPCDGCKHLTVKLVSPEGKRLQQACKLYRVAVSRCADWVKV